MAFPSFTLFPAANLAPGETLIVESPPAVVVDPGRPGGLSSVLPGGASLLADDVYPILAPLADGADADAAAGWPLGHYVAALLAPVTIADRVAAEPRLLLDVDLAPVELLSSVEQSTGTPVDKRLSETMRRDRVRRRSSERQGRNEEIRAAVAETLTAPALIRLIERYDPARPDLDFYGADARFHLTIVTRTTQTPDPALTARRAQDAAPMRVLVHHVVSEGVTYDEAAARTYDSAGAAGNTYNTPLDGSLT
ncbi:MAG: hypothetical protein AVDCRST_MAG68-2136 [uncultured Gemmatimonadetes bacterium]|uniref:Uncharacterized protein n=1 Tax=uncultured Gemmatimonadota bacterium TaxID=203437 RepID=A0A6J4LB46_9BACT|nr:MAG: hypothetical protein AVDCRST_MAG68-2136 [uncultured Gemmatimonadota bacterium]